MSVKLVALALCSLSLFVATGVSAQEVRFSVTVEAGNQARVHAPASVRIGVDALPVDVVKLAGGIEPSLVSTEKPVKAVPAQIEFSRKDGKDDGAVDALIVHWIEARLDPGQSRQYTLTLLPAKAPADAEKRTGSDRRPVFRSFQYADGAGYKELLYDKIPIYRHVNEYEAASSAKPFHHLYGFRGDGFITKGAGGQFPHQRGVFLGWNNTRAGGKTYDFWSCDSASQRHRGYVKERETAGPVFARSAAVTEWLDPSGKALVRDTREVTAWAIEPGEQSVLDFAVTLEALGGDVELAGDPHHGGFQIRAAQEVADRPVDTQYVFPEGAKPEAPASAAAARKSDRSAAAVKAGEDDDDGGAEGKAGVVRNTDWVVSFLKIRGHTYGVVLMNHPQVPRPATHVVRSYGRIGSFFETQLRKGSPVTARYRIIVLDAEKYSSRDVKDYDALYRTYRNPLKGNAVPARAEG